MLERTVHLPAPIDVARTISALQRGRVDPTCRVERHEIWRTTRTPAGPCTLRLQLQQDHVHAEAWGEGAEAALDGVPSLIGMHDDISGFDPGDGVVARIWHDNQALRIPRSGAVTETLINVVLEQRVTTFEARRAQHQIVERWSEPAPGPTDLLLPPDPEVLAGVAYYDLHLIGVEKKRADTVRRVAAAARRLDALATRPAGEADVRLQELPGVGPWSAAGVAFCALGDADAVPVGDVHLPSQITYALTGEAIDDDERMLEVLAPFAPHRGRVIQLVLRSGVRPPRQAPRYAPRDIRDQ